MHKKRVLFLAGILAGVLAASPAAAQITRGADQPNQNKWNAKGPWGKTERSAPIEAQRKKAFKVFDNVWYVGFQTVSVYLVSTSDGLVLIDAGYAQTVDWLLENRIVRDYRGGQAIFAHGRAHPLYSGNV